MSQMASWEFFSFLFFLCSFVLLAIHFMPLSRMLESTLTMKSKRKMRAETTERLLKMNIYKKVVEVMLMKNLWIYYCLFLPSLSYRFGVEDEKGNQHSTQFSVTFLTSQLISFVLDYGFITPIDSDWFYVSFVVFWLPEIV